MEQEKKAKEKKEKPKKSLQREIFECIMVLVVAAALAFVVRTFIFEPVRVDGSSMLNTLENNEFMIATKFDYLAGDPERFDVVNGEFVEQNFEMTPNETDFGPFTVPEGHYFVMGDNRNNSKDSRSPMVGALERKMIKGHVRCVVFPLSKARILGK